MAQNLFPDQAALGEFCRHHHIRRLALFGSTLKGTAHSDSDLDLLVEFEPGNEPGLIKLAGMEAELSAMLGNRRVDLRTAEDLSRHFRDEVVRTAEIQYAV
ncbi:MAG TPA: nucleotidyltransferase family protein [Reyranella sp.]|jgi:predicted nucleotidyltransferase|nr:nucleotidyltransferase family protein [Reyranella sp.]